MQLPKIFVFAKQGTTCPDKSGDFPIGICRRHHFVGFATNPRQQGVGGNSLYFGAERNREIH